jgi:hypothetical protein
MLTAGCGNRSHKTEIFPDSLLQAPLLSVHPATKAQQPDTLRWTTGGGIRHYYVDPQKSLDGLRAESIILPSLEGHGYTLGLRFSEQDAAKLRAFVAAHPADIFVLRFGSGPVRDNGSGVVNEWLVNVDLSHLKAGDRGITLYTDARSAGEARGVANRLVGR